MALAFLLLIAFAGLAYALGTDSRREASAQEIEMNAITSTSLTTAFNYQGQLKSDGVAINGSCDFKFCLYDAPSLGSQVGITLTHSISVTNGLFTAELDFGDVFTGNAVWLGIQVKCPDLGDVAFTDLGRQALTATPYALYSQQSDLLDGLDSTDFWKIDGNAGIDENTHFLGTTDDQDLVFKTNGNEVMRIFNEGIVAVGASARYDFKMNVSGDGTLNGIHVRDSGTGIYVTDSETGIYVANDGTGILVGNGDTGIHVVNADTGIYASGSDVGVEGYSYSGDAIKGRSVDGEGVDGRSVNDDGVFGYSDLDDGVYGRSDGYSTGACGVYGYSENGMGVSGKGVFGVMGNGDQWDFYASGGEGYGPFTGAHEVKLAVDFPADTQPGMIVVVNGDSQARMTDKGEISLSSTLPTVQLSNSPQDPNVFGVLISEDPLMDGHWYIPNEGERFGVVNALGEGRVWVTNINGDIQSGDYITTSSIPGYGRMQVDDLLHSYTLGKAIEDVDWDAVTETVEFEGQIYKIYLVAVVYTSG